MMLPYLEQAPLYNAANFSWVSGWALGYTINSTVTNTTIDGVHLPLRRYVAHPHHTLGHRG